MTTATCPTLSAALITMISRVADALAHSGSPSDRELFALWRTYPLRFHSSKRTD